MNIIFSNHAKLRLQGRRISEEMVKFLVNCPILTDTDCYDENVIHYYGKFDDKVLRVVGKTQKGYILIITAFFDRSMRGKL